MKGSEIVEIILSVVSIIIPIIYSKKERSLSISYEFLQNKNKYILFFWNSSARVIKKDVINLKIIAPIGSKILVLHSNDKIPVKVSKHKYVKFTNDLNSYVMFKVQMEYIYVKKGYVVQIEAPSDKDKIGLYGRIKYEDKFSVRYSHVLYKGDAVINTIQRRMESIKHYVELVIYIIIIILGISFVRYGNGIIYIIGWIYFFMGVIGSYAEVVRAHIPLDLKKYYKVYKKDGYNRLENLEKLILYQDMDLKIERITDNKKELGADESDID